MQSPSSRIHVHFGLHKDNSQSCAPIVERRRDLTKNSGEVAFTLVQFFEWTELVARMVFKKRVSRSKSYVDFYRETNLYMDWELGNVFWMQNE